MKIILENFGIIKKFEFDTDDDFTFIIGTNNTGKSYAISAIYLIMKNILEQKEIFMFRYNFFKEGDILSKVNSYEKSLKEKNTVNIKKDMEEIIKNILEIFLIKSINESFNNTFDSIDNLENKLNNKELLIKINTNLINLSIKIKNKELYIYELVINRKIELKKSKRNLSTKLDESSIKIYMTKNQQIFLDRIRELIIYLLEDITTDSLKHIKDVHFLPASRSGLYQALSAFGQIIAELSKSRKFTSKKIELPSISEPVSDYFLKLSNIKISSSKKQNKSIEVAKFIEEKILNGKVKFKQDTKKLIFNPNNTSLELDLSYTSSMVSEISPIVSFLRYIINNNESYFGFLLPRTKKNNKTKPLIIIEEPEAHLHPDIQIELLNQFVELAKNDVKFILTTHSNYMFNKFNNLILSKELNINKTNCLIFKETETGSNIKKMDIDEYGIEDENFVYTSEKLYNEKLDIIEKMNDLEND